MAIMAKHPGFPVINIILVGSSGVGKASLKWRHLDGRFPEYVPKVYHLCEDLKQLNEIFCYLDLTEIIGDEDYDRLRPIVYSKINENVVALMCYTVNDMASFDRLRSKLIEEIREVYGNEIPMILLGMKSDLLVEASSDDIADTSLISQSMVGELAKEMNIPKILTCSALTGQGIKSLIDEAVRMSPLFRDSFRQTTDKACCCDLL